MQNVIVYYLFFICFKSEVSVSGKLIFWSFLKQKLYLINDSAV